MPDLSSLPVSAGLVLGLILYAGVSLFGTGPLVGERLIERVDWDAQCHRELVADLKARTPSAPPVPKLGCRSVFGGLFGRDGQRLCERHGDFALPGLDQLAAHRRRLEEQRRQRLQRAAARTGSQCRCAANLTLEKRRTAFALHTGSLRLMTPAPVRDLRHELTASLADPLCRIGGGS